MLLDNSEKHNLMSKSNMDRHISDRHVTDISVQHAKYTDISVICKACPLH